MTTTEPPAPERRLWSLAGVGVVAAHAAIAALLAVFARPSGPPPREAVMLVELPPMAAPAPQAEAVAHVQPEAGARPAVAQSLAIDVPQVSAPLPEDAVALPPAAPEPVRSVVVPAPVSVPIPGPAAGAVAADPRARKAELDYFALLSAHLNRRKAYPAEARRARQEGVVTVRFTVDREGNVSGAAIRRSSGHDLLDMATLDLLRRVAPLPKMPPTMARDSVSISLPIEYALRTS